MKYGKLSIILAVIGILFVTWYNFEAAKLFESEFLKLQYQIELNPTVYSTGKWNKFIALSIAVIGIILGIKSWRDKIRIGIIGILLSILLIILTFIPIWQYIVTDSALDINFVN